MTLLLLKHNDSSGLDVLSFPLLCCNTLYEPPSSYAIYHSNDERLARLLLGFCRTFQGMQRWRSRRHVIAATSSLQID